MNERIKELSRKSFMLAHEANDLHEQEEGEELSQTEFSNVFNQKFAELIVKECARIGELKEQGSVEYDPDVSVGHYMRQHFGTRE